ncbi:MAG TPA: hypothetical protein VN758_11700, partial [Solirubrobacterales bacterium]|nr:hypothetical protein [Solirubrobacterales bacterium]
GCIYLLSSGKSQDASYIFDASASGDDVFIATRSPFVRQDQDQLYDVYDASVGGGLASQNQIPNICEGEACKGPAGTPPAPQSPGTASFSGPANPKPKRSKPKHKKTHGKKGKGKGHKHKKHKRASSSRRVDR